MMDLVVKLRELRRDAGLTQKDVGRLTGLGNRTISSFETGQRVGSMKLSQFEKILRVYGVSIGDFFSYKLEQRLDPLCDADLRDELSEIIDALGELPEETQRTLIRRFALMVESTHERTVMQQREPMPQRGHAMHDLSREWEMMTSRN